MENVEYKIFSPDEHLPGVSTVVAVSDGGVVGFAQIQGDGVLQAHLSNFAVDEEHRGWGIGKRLVAEAFERSGRERVDLISTEGSEAFYESFRHKTRLG